MTTPLVLLVIIGTLGAFDIVYFHHYRCRLNQRPESQTESVVHVVRGVVYVLQLGLLPNVAFHGYWYVAFVSLFVADVAIAWIDVWIEPASRASQGGLPRGEYFMHIVLSVLVGAYLHGLAISTMHWTTLPTALVVEPAPVPALLRWTLNVMAIGCALATLWDLLEIVDRKLGRPKPLHIRALMKCSLERLWGYTQDHREHPKWDHRFSNIEMLDDVIQTGTTMRYEKRILGITIRGFGRYKLHRPLKQSTFEFWSDSPLSLIRRGVGLWLYRPQDDGTILFSTAYTYEVRWGLIGRLVDRFLFRPLMQWETERSFRRLERMKI